MAKKVRIENADIGAAKAVVQVWEKGDGSEPDTLVSEVEVGHMTPVMVATCEVTATRYVLVKEAA